SALKEDGYRTGIFGKWHLGDTYPYRPEYRGFDKAVVHGGGGVSQTPDYWGNDYFDDTYRINGEPEEFEGYCTDVWFNQALKFIKENKEKDSPFFCYIPTNAPHSPFNIEEKYYKLYEDQLPEDRAHFYGMITNIDENFGILRKKLKEWELEDNTILIFMSDNGTACGVNTDSEGFVIDGYNAGMRGQKGSEYDGGHRTPCFIRWPGGKLEGGRDIDRLTANVDIMPTLLELCEIPVKEGIKFHGDSIAPLLYGEEEEWEDRVIVTDSQRVAHPVKWKQSSVMTDKWRLVNGEELYDINNDQEQRNNVAEKHPQVVEKLREEYEKWWEIVSEQFDKEIPAVLKKNHEETALTCHDWRNEDCSCPWNQKEVRRGMAANGYWEIRVEDAGEYEIELRRWPREAGHAITAGIEGDDIEWRSDIIMEDYRNWYSEGKALPIKQAGLEIDDKTYSKKVNPEDEYVSFKLKLEEGSYHLKTRFTDGENFEIGAYYVYIR
ncbi:MAG: arylsulfatase, partial [bacterium]